MTDTPPHDKHTCGEVYRQLIELLFAAPPEASVWPTSPEPGGYGYECFAMGFMAGQAEKVASGACPAFMVRVDPAWASWAQEAMTLLCVHYRLLLLDGPNGELWGVDPAWETMARATLALPYPSVAGHVDRAWLCGIRQEDIDVAYHERPTHGVRCEPVDKK